MTTAWGARVAMVLVALVGLAACSDESGSADEKPSAAPTTEDSSFEDASPTPTRSPSPTEPSTTDAAESRCLFTLAQVSRVLGGEWDRAPQGAVCLYSSDRGAFFTTTQVHQAIEPGLRDAREACVDGIRPISVGDGFVCVEIQDKGEIVVGNIAVGDELWVILIVPPSGTASKAELSAMMVLVEAAQALTGG